MTDSRKTEAPKSDQNTSVKAEAGKAAPTQSHYEVLGVKPDASEAEIKKAYHAEVMKNHPDKNNNSPESQEKTTAITNAKEVLLDPEKRAAYDQEQKQKQIEVATNAETAKADSTQLAKPDDNKKPENMQIVTAKPGAEPAPPPQADKANAKSKSDIDEEPKPKPKQQKKDASLAPTKPMDDDPIAKVLKFLIDALVALFTGGKNTYFGPKREESSAPQKPDINQPAEIEKTNNSSMLEALGKKSEKDPKADANAGAKADAKADPRIESKADPKPAAIQDKMSENKADSAPAPNGKAEPAKLEDSKPAASTSAASNPGGPKSGAKQNATLAIEAPPSGADSSKKVVNSENTGTIGMKK